MGVANFENAAFVGKSDSFGSKGGFEIIFLQNSELYMNRLVWPWAGWVW